MKKILSFFKKSKTVDKNVNQVGKVENELEEIIEENMIFPFFEKEVEVSFPVDKKDQIFTLVDDLSLAIKQNANDLFVKSIETAVEFIEFTGESFDQMFDEEDVPEEAEEFMIRWNSGDDEVLVGFIDRWFSKEQAKKIVENIRQKGKSYTNLSELQLACANSVLELGLAKYNFGSVYLAIKDSFVHNPHAILNYMDLSSIHLTMEGTTMVWYLCFSCDWEVEHGIDWIMKDDKPIFVGSDGLSLSRNKIILWDKIHTSSR